MFHAVSEIVAPRGSPLAFAVVGCESLERSTDFYRDVIGLDPSPPLSWAGGAFEALWSLPPGARARACLLAADDSPVGRILLVEFAAARRERVLPEPHSRVIGIANLNFYVRDIQAATARLGAAGCPAWTPPTQHDFAAAVGNPIEVLLDGPDGVPFNLVQLASADPATRVGQMRAYVERAGYTRGGFTGVVTSSHVCRSLSLAREFCERVLGMGALIDEVLGSPRVNAFLRLPADGRTHVTFMQGGHMFGKAALAEPLNYLDACVDLRPRAAAPAIGPLAHAFEVEDLRAAAAGCEALGVEWIMRPRVVEIPGLGPRECLAVRNPGSGAPQWVLGYSR
jgi:catechol 2,3-dioxygenase-like lactoylglutathione lyase family enzyme